MLFARTSAARFPNNAARCIWRLGRQFHSSPISLAVKDPYGALGVSKNATSREIKKAYYQLAKKYHPDVNKEPGTDQKFQDIQSAYEILSDDKKKAQFDQFGSAAFDGGAGAGGPGGFGGAGGFGGQDGPFNPFGNFSGFNFGGAQGGGGGQSFNFEDIFGAFSDMGGGSRGRGRNGGMMHYKGDDIEVLAHVTLEDAAAGKSLQVKYSVLDECGSCHGTGLKTGHSKKTCPSCGGSGSQVHLMQGGFQMASTCGTCRGSGVTIPRSSECGECHAQGVVQKSKSTTVDIPPGIADGMRLKVTGGGDSPAVLASSNVQRSKGDLYVRVKVKPHEKFIRSKNDLLYNCTIPMTTAALGGKIGIPVLGAKSEIQLNVPRGTQPGRTVSIPDQGLPVLNRKGMKGDLKVTFGIKIPQPTTDKQTSLLEQLAIEFGDKSARVSPSQSSSSSASDSASPSSATSGSSDASTQKSDNHNNKNNNTEDSHENGKGKDTKADHDGNTNSGGFLKNLFKKKDGQK